MITSTFSRLIAVLSFSNEPRATINVTDTDAFFTYPTGQDFTTSFQIGQSITIAWENAENFTHLSLGLRHSLTAKIFWLIGSPISSVPSNYKANNYPWTIALGNDITLEDGELGNAFSFWLVDGGYQIQIASTHFNITDPKSSTSSSSTAAATPSANSSSQSFIPFITNPTPTSHAAPTPELKPESSGIPLSTKVAIGISIPVAFVILGALVWWALFRRRRRMRGADAMRFDMVEPGMGVGDGEEGGMGAGKSELPADGRGAVKAVNENLVEKSGDESTVQRVELP